MSDARHAFLAHLIDDAALFPPASLPLGEAVAEHRLAAAGPHSWMQGRFLCPASRLPDLAAALDGDAGGWTIGAVLDGPARGGAWVEAVRADLDVVASFAEHAAVDLVEVPLPAGDPGAAVAGMADALGAAGLGAVLPCLEVPFGGQWDEQVPAVVAMIGDVGASAKIRCGGPSPGDFPAPGQLARFVAACRDAEVSFKATAGLHHPVRRPDPVTGATMHGFLNLGAAAVAACARGATEERLTEILEETDPAAFRLDETGCGWREHIAGGAEVAAVREALFLSYGSCSFSEPVVDLVALGVLTASR